MLLTFHAEVEQFLVHAELHRDPDDTVGMGRWEARLFEDSGRRACMEGMDRDHVVHLPPSLPMLPWDNESVIPVRPPATSAALIPLLHALLLGPVHRPTDVRLDTLKDILHRRQRGPDREKR